MAKHQPEKMNLCCVGAGYVGSTTMAVIAKHCPHIRIVVVDINQRKIDAWNSENLPIYEPGLKELIDSQRGVNLFFSTDVDGGIRSSEIIFVAVDTQTKLYGLGRGQSYDLTATESVARKIAAVSNSSKIVVEKSTVPVRTGEKIRIILNSNKHNPDIHFEVISNPEFLAEGQAIQNLEEPSRVLIGSMDTEEGHQAVETIAAIYKYWVPPERIITTNIWSSELSKLAANAMLAQRISSINAISAVCETTGASVTEVARVMGADPRLGPHFLQTSVGFGGSCFKKDILGLVYLCEHYQLYEVAEYWRQIVTINEYQKMRFAKKIVESMFGSVRNKRIALFGFAFKKNTGDIRESPAIEISRVLLEEGAKVVMYDPKVKLEEVHELGDPWKKIVMERDAYSAAYESHAVVVLTEWDEFKTLQWQRLFSLMVKPAFVFDGRNILNHEALHKLGFQVYGIGKPFLYSPPSTSHALPSKL